MTIGVIIKQVPLTSDVAIDPVTGVIQRESGETKMNPYDLYALETALRLVKEYGGTTSVLTMGPPQAEAIIREAYAMGIDEGHLLSDRAFAGSDVLATSHALSQGIMTLDPFDLIICGKQTTDGDTAQVGPECSEFLHIPCVAAVRRIEGCSDGTITITNDDGANLVSMKVRLPALLSVEKDLYQPRLPSYVRRKETLQRKIRKITLQDLSDREPSHYGLEGSPTQVRKIFPPERNEEFELWESGDLAKRLFEYLDEGKYLQEKA